MSISPSEPVKPALEPLTGYSVAITAARRREEFGTALTRRGASVVYGPAIQIVPLADDSELLAATRSCLQAPLDIVVATTGIGFRGWVETADTWGLADQLCSAIGNASVLARGPKARGAIRACGLREEWSPQSESSSEVLEHLMTSFDVTGMRIAVQLHGEPLPDMVDTLRMAGADVIEVPVYRWMPPTDAEPLQRMISAVAAGSIDCVAFTSAPAAASFLHMADTQGCGEPVRSRLRSSVIAACVGPVTAGPLLREGISVVQPVRGRLGALVREIVEQVPRRCGIRVHAAGHELDVRGHGVVIDGRFAPLSASGMSLLRALLARPGQVVPRCDLFPGTGSDEHAVEVAIGRLRASLGDSRIVQTVVKRGYRLAFEPERVGATQGTDPFRRY